MILDPQSPFSRKARNAEIWQTIVYCKHANIHYLKIWWKWKFPQTETIIMSRKKWDATGNLLLSGSVLRIRLKVAEHNFLE